MLYEGVMQRGWGAASHLSATSRAEFILLSPFDPPCASGEFSAGGEHATNIPRCLTSTLADINITDKCATHRSGWQSHAVRTTPIAETACIMTLDEGSKRRHLTRLIIGWPHSCGVNKGSLKKLMNLKRSAELLFCTGPDRCTWKDAYFHAVTKWMQEEEDSCGESYGG